MQTSAELVLTAPAARRLPGLAGLAAVWRFMRRKPIGAIGLVVLVVFVALALLAPAISPHNPNIGIQGKRYISPSPSSAFPLGTDKFGRDELSRMLNGATISLEVGIFTVALGLGIGLIVGMGSAYFGGRSDFVVQRVVDSFQSLPRLIFALAIVTALGRSLTNVVIALAVASWPGWSRVIRSSVLSIRQLTYVDAARAIGASDLRILGRHVLPNVVPIAIILATAGLADAILTEASLSFLGVGIRPPTPSWGSMINEFAGVIQEYPYLVLFPGIAICIVVFAFNFVGDALRDYLDPRLRGTR